MLRSIFFHRLLNYALTENSYSQEFEELAKEDPNPYYQELVDQVNEDDLRSFVTYPCDGWV